MRIQCVFEFDIESTMCRHFIIVIIQFRSGAAVIIIIIIIAIESERSEHKQSNAIVILNLKIEK